MAVVLPKKSFIRLVLCRVQECPSCATAGTEVYFLHFPVRASMSQLRYALKGIPRFIGVRLGPAGTLVSCAY